MIKLASARLAQPVDGTSPSNPGGGWGNSNRAPVITSNGGGSAAAVAALENFKPVTTVTSTDPDLGATRFYSIAGGIDAAKFVINSATGELSFVTAPNFETPTDSGANNIYDVVVKVSDGKLSDQQSLAITVGNVNEAPVITSGGGGTAAAVTVAENTVAVIKVTSADADAGSTKAYSIIGGADSSKFTINAATGELSFISAPNFEAPGDSGANNIYDVVVKVSDGVLSDTQSLAVSVGNVNEAPVITSGGGGVTAAVTLAENTTAVMTVTSSDSDAGKTATYSIAGGVDAAKFTIDSVTGALRFVTGPDFESPADAGANNSYDVKVQVSNGTLTDTQSITVNVANVAENTGTTVGGGTSSTTGPGTAITVANAAELMSALQHAAGGEVISLKAGDYGSLQLIDQKNFFAQFSSQVTITSADPGHPASFAGLDLRGVDNLKFDGVTFDYNSASGAALFTNPFALSGCENVAIINSAFDGDLAHGVNAVADGFGTGKALTVTNSSNIVIDNNSFDTWHRGAIFMGSNNVSVTGNEVRNMSSDGFDFANVDNVVIKSNYMHDFNFSPLTLAHPDMIQFWTNGTTSPSVNITISDNFLDAGDGRATQSIFMRNDMVDRGLAGPEMFYQNITISNNLIVNGHSHGITVGEANGVTIDNNTLLQMKTIAEGGSVSVPTINVVTGCTGVTVTDNVLPGLSTAMLTARDGWFVGNNILAQRDDMNASNFIGKLYSDALAAHDTTLADFQVIPGSIVDLANAGSTLAPHLADGAVAGFVLGTDVSAGGFMVQAFDVTNIYTNAGKVDLSNAIVTWDFGDGKTGTGLLVEHIYETAGAHTATATITLNSGLTVTVDKTIVAQSGRLLDFAFDGSAADLSPVANAVVLTSATFEQGPDGGALRLNGGTVKVDATSDMFGNSEFTLLADFRKDAATTGTGGRLAYFSGNFIVTVMADGIEASVTTTKGTVTLKAYGVGINDADWHKLALTFSGETGTASLFLDGAKVAQVTGLDGASQLAATTADLYLGGPYGGSFTGLIDNVHFFGDALSASQIASGDPLAAAAHDAAVSSSAISSYLQSSSFQLI